MSTQFPLPELSQNEARVLHSLIKWPELPDNEIHGHIGMKKSTFSSIKNRLKESGYYRRYFVPNFPHLGLELSFIHFGELNRYSNFEEQDRVAGKLIRGFVEDIFQLSENNQFLAISVAENYSEYCKNFQQFYKIYMENNFLNRTGLDLIAFPFETSKMNAFLDFESLVASQFGFASVPYSDRISISHGKVEHLKLTKAHRKVMMGLVKYPDETDTLIAEEVGVSRNTVANAKERFMESEILIPRVVPNLSKLGFKILIFQYLKFNPKNSHEIREEENQMIRRCINPFFYVTKKLAGYTLSAHTSREEFEKCSLELKKFYSQTEYLLEPPTVIPIPLDTVHITRDYGFVELLGKILGFDPIVRIMDQE